MFICSRLEKKEASDCEKAFFLLKSKKKTCFRISCVKSRLSAPLGVQYTDDSDNPTLIFFSFYN